MSLNLKIRVKHRFLWTSNNTYETNWNLKFKLFDKKNHALTFLLLIAVESHCNRPGNPTTFRRRWGTDQCSAQPQQTRVPSEPVRGGGRREDRLRHRHSQRYGWWHRFHRTTWSKLINLLIAKKKSYDFNDKLFAGNIGLCEIIRGILSGTDIQSTYNKTMKPWTRKSRPDLCRVSDIDAFIYRAPTRRSTMRLMLGIQRPTISSESTHAWVTSPSVNR